MKTFLIKALIGFVFIPLLFSQKAYAIDKVKTIVVFFSLDVNLPAYRGFLDGLNKQFSEKPGQANNLIIEYIDINRFSDEADIANIIGLYKEKFKTVDIDLLITFGPGTFQLLKNHDFLVIGKTPIINIDIERNIPDKMDWEENVLHINIRTDYEKTLQTATELFPKSKDIYIISGSSPADQYFAALTKQASEKFKESHNFVFCSNKTLDSTLMVVRNIPQNSIVFATSYIEDANQIPYSTAMVNRIISDNSKAPFFTLSDDFLEGGAIGGYVYSFNEVGRQTGIITEDILNGKSLTKISVDENSFNRHMYDWQMLKKWELLDSKAIPDDSIIFNKPKNFFLDYRWYILGLLAFIISQTILILYLIRLNKKQKIIARRREENEQLYRELVREDRLARMSELTASLSHELNQPLTAILYNAQAGKRFLESGKLDDKQAAEILDNIIEDDKRAGNLISSIRSLMKLENREKEQVDLNNLIKETMRLFHSETIAQHIQISNKIKNAPTIVFGDKIQLQQVFLNLLFNAAIAMQNNNPESKKIEITREIDNDLVSILIRDFGPGIKESMIKTLFKPFNSSGTEGLGIGLAVSRSIIENHQGTIQARNHPDGGAEFSFTLKLSNNE